MKLIKTSQPGALRHGEKRREMHAFERQVSAKKKELFSDMEKACFELSNARKQVEPDTKGLITFGVRWPW